MLFDLDGVLIDSFESWFEAINTTLEKYGLEKISKENFRKNFWGYDVKSNLKKFGLGNDAVKYCNEKHFGYLDKIKILKASGPVLEKISKMFRIALVTNSPKNEVMEIVKMTKWKFDAIITGDDVNDGKPNPEAITKACKALGIKPKEALLVGDTKADVDAGHRAGCIVVGVGIDADFSINNVSELLAILSYIRKNKI
ncbi:MAG: HAD-IA family hydrolase [Candidatus Aenigmatarchaeota archaeon]